MEKFCTRIIGVALFLIPFVAWTVSEGKLLHFFASEGATGMFFPFISGKNILFRLLTEVAFVSWVALAYTKQEYRPRFSLPLVAYSVFLVVILVADLLGIDPERSIFSSFERSEGFITHIHLFLYFLVLTSTFRTKEMWKKYMVPGFILSNILVTLWAMFQLIGRPDFLDVARFGDLVDYFSTLFPIHQSGNRLDSTLGNAAYYGIYAVMSIFVWAIIWSYVKKNLYRIGILAAMLFNVVGLYYSGTRGSILGLIIGAIAATALVAFPWKHFKYAFFAAVVIVLSLFSSFFAFPKYALHLFVALIVLGIGMSIRSYFVTSGKLYKVSTSIVLFFFVLMGMFVLARNTSFVAESAVLSRFTNLTEDSTANSRLMIWGMSYEGFKEKPILGWGQENFMYVFAKYYDPGMYGQEPWFDRSHNVVFDWLIAGGILGLLSYFALFGSAFYILWKRKDHTSPLERSLLTGLLIAYFIHNLLVFDNIVSYLFFFGILAYIVTITRRDGDRYIAGPLFKHEYPSYLFYGFAFVLFVFCVYKPYIANKALVKAIDVQYVYGYKNNGDLVAGIKDQRAYFETALHASSVSTQETREQLVRFVPELMSVNLTEAPEQVKTEFTKEVAALAETYIKEIEKDEASGSIDARAYQMYGAFFRSIGEYEKSEHFFESAHALAPKKQRTSFDLITAYIAVGKKDEAYALAKETFLVETSYDDAKQALIFVAIEVKKLQDAMNTFKSVGATLPYPPDLAAILAQITDRNERKTYADTLASDHPEKKAEIQAALAKTR